MTAVTDKHYDFSQAMRDAHRAVPEIFDREGRILALLAGRPVQPSSFFAATSPVDGSRLAELPALNATRANEAVEAAHRAFAEWSSRPLWRIADNVAAGVAALRRHRALLIRILAWEIGKTPKTAATDVDRCLAGIDWYLENIGTMLAGRHPIGLVSNIASWNYPFSVLILNMLVQVLSGNAVIAKIPTQGGGISLSIAVALLQRSGLPVTLVGGRGPELSEALVAHPAIAGVTFVGGRKNGAAVYERLAGTQKRFAIEMEGINAYAITDFSDWQALSTQIRAGFDYGKQRCTAYTRWVVERSLVPKFIETYVSAVSSLAVGHPFGDKQVDYGPLISSAKVDELETKIAEAEHHGATRVYAGSVDASTFAPGQDAAAYMAPILLSNVGKVTSLYEREPFGPVDVLRDVANDDELVHEANVSQGALVASVATDDPERGEALARRLAAFKVGINAMRSRGDREEAFGGVGGSWKGAFVGGANLVRAFTEGPNEPAGNW